MEVGDQTRNIHGPEHEQEGRFAYDRLRKGKLEWRHAKLHLVGSDASDADLVYIGVIKGSQLGGDTGTTWIIDPSAENLANMLLVFETLPKTAAELLSRQVTRDPNGYAATRLGEHGIQHLQGMMRR